jgi:hypothetical protein
VPQRRQDLGGFGMCAAPGSMGVPKQGTLL